MPVTGLSEILSQIPKRTRNWVHKHEVPDILGPDNKMIPRPANRAERRALARAARRPVYAFLTPYEKPQED